MDIDEVVEKIKKAVRLANRTTSEGERETAMRLAKSLAEKNGVAFEEVADEASGVEDAAVKEDDEAERTTTGSEIGLALMVLRHHFGVIVMKNFRRANPWKSRLSWFGSRLNIAIARHVYIVLVRESRRAWREAQREVEKEPTTVKLDRYAFMRGFFFAIHKKLTAQPLRNDLATCIRAAERRLLAFQRENGISVSEAKGGGKVKDADALAAGYAAGEGVNLARPCENGKGAATAIGHDVKLLTA